MEKYYRFAGVELIIRIPDERMYRQDLQLTNFRTDRVMDPHLCEVSVVSALVPPEGSELANLPGERIYASAGGYVRYHGSVEEDVANAYIRSLHRGKHHEIALTEELVSGIVSPRLVLNSLDVEHLISSRGGVILHASYIQWQDKAIVFTAPSETGKSTQAELWKTYRNARIINGDRAALIPGDGMVCAAGLPFSGSSRYCENETLPLAAVVCLKQAPVTTIRTLRGVQAFRQIWEGCNVNTWNREDLDRSMGLVEKLLGQVPVFELACTPDESAVLALEQQLRKQVSQ